MITSEKLKIYEKYKGDIDGWARTGSKKEHKIMKDEDWSAIDKLIQKIELVEQGLTSKKFADNLNIEIKEYCDNQKTIEKLKRLTKKRP